MAPVIGFHWVIDNPLSVSRVMPPTATITTTMTATIISQLASAIGRACLLFSDMASSVVCSRGWRKCKSGKRQPGCRNRRDAAAIRRFYLQEDTP